MGLGSNKKPLSFWRMRRSASKATSSQKDRKNENNGEEAVVIDWEMRPCGLLVQKRRVDPAPAPPTIKIKISYDSYHHVVTVPSQSTFGDLKRVLGNKIGLEPRAQRLLFRGKEKDEDECLHMAGVQDLSKLILMEDPASKEIKSGEPRKNHETTNAYEAVAKVRAEINELSVKVLELDKAAQNGNKIVNNKEVVVLTELLMTQLLQLDSIEANGDAREQRRTEVHRVQTLIDKLDNLKTINPHNGFSNCGTARFGHYQMGNLRFKI